MSTTVAKQNLEPLAGSSNRYSFGWIIRSRMMREEFRSRRKRKKNAASYQSTIAWTSHSRNCAWKTYVRRLLLYSIYIVNSRVTEPNTGRCRKDRLSTNHHRLAADGAEMEIDDLSTSVADSSHWAQEGCRHDVYSFPGGSAQHQRRYLTDFKRPWTIVFKPRKARTQVQHLGGVVDWPQRWQVNMATTRGWNY